MGKAPDVKRKTVAERIRSILFWIHLVTGVVAGSVILLMSVTGVMLGFERQMIVMIDGAAVVTPPASPAASPLALDSLFSRAGLVRAGIASVVVRSAPTAPVLVRFHDRAVPPRALDPYTAATIATPQGGKGQAFFSALRRWHRWIGASAVEARARARAVTGAANLAFLFLVLSGLWLWWPRQWTVATLRTTLRFQPRLRGKARDFNWHHALGFWSAVPLALVVATGVFISYQWPGRWLDRALGSADERAAARGGPARPAAPSAPAAPAPTPAPRQHELSVASLFDAGVRARPDWTAITMTLASPRDTAHSVLVAGGNTYRPDLRATLIIDADGPAPTTLAVRDYASLSTSRKIRAWVRFGHTGEVFGIPGQVLATLVTGVGAVLVWTGIALALRRLWAWRRRRVRSAVPAPHEAPAT
jgi:uncharacterized iron-regulated membrane protein